MKILIAGGGGFIGSTLLRHLSAQHDCVCFGHGRRFRELQSRIGGDIVYVEGDLIDAQLLRDVLTGVDAVIHAAGTGGESDCLSNPTQSVLTHIHGTQLLLSEVRRQNIERFIFTSTIAVYGTYQSRPMPLTEDMDPRPDEFYGALKTTAERAIVDSGRYQIFRLANVYGYGGGLLSGSGGVAEKFIERIAEGDPLRVFGDGSQLIDYVHVTDVCRAYEAALGLPAEQNFICNLGGGAPLSIRNLAETCTRIAESENCQRPEVEYAPAPASKRWPDRWLSIEKAERELGWRPQVSMESGLRDLLMNWPREVVLA
jgi:UDP-glucose 4-epimerase